MGANRSIRSLGIIIVAVTAGGSTFHSGQSARAESKPVAMQDYSLGSDVRIKSVELRPGLGVVAGTAPGDAVYSNTSTAPGVYAPGAGQPMADDLTLASGPCNLVYYEVAVYGGSVIPGQVPPPSTFQIELQLFEGDPCEGGLPIAGTDAVVPDIPANDSIQIIGLTLDAPVAIPGTVWLQATFSIDRAGWIVAQQTELGSTQNLFSEDDVSLGCGLFVLTSSYAGFWTTLHCNLDEDPVGACCDLADCTQTTQGDCTNGVWQGAFTTCQPNICQSGTCCGGLNFDQCADSNEAHCADGAFTPNNTCAEGCPDNFKVYENDFRTGLFTGVSSNTKFGDDLIFAPGTPCDLLAYDVTVFGDPDNGPATFDVTLELWTNDDQGTPTVPADDIPLAPIPGTARQFNGVAADFTGHRLLASGFTGLPLPDKAWVVIAASSDNGGPGLAGLADIGESLDLFAVFNDSGAPNAWTGGFFFGGFDPDGACPGSPQGTPPPCPAGSFRTNVWCAGNPPTGACCDRFAGACTEGVTFGDCAGRWAEAQSCEPETFFPECGKHACCERFEFNPNVTVCVDRTPEDCATRDDGFLSLGKFCDDLDNECPAAICMGHDGDCHQPQPDPGCEDPFCTCAVCNDPDGGSFCCQIEWDDVCAEIADTLCPDQLNDLCSLAEPISGPGVFPFDNTDAGTDGPAHAACGSETGDQITRDVWFAWTATCTNTVFVSTCNRTFVDTKIAVYDGASCPPTDGNLLSCNDDRCGLQTMATFEAVSGQQYLIRIGSAPSQGAGAGSFEITCGPINNPACTAAAGDCCAATGTPACSNESCCETVCTCDSFCCSTEWDEACATIGFEGSGCGAAVLCDSCSMGCPPGPLTDVAPPSGVVDARRPIDLKTGTPAEGIGQIILAAPAGAEASCFELCETAASNGANDIAGFTNMAGLVTLQLLRPITANAVTTISYSNVLGGGATGVYISHPGNVNADGIADSNDAQALANALSGSSLPWDLFSSDIDQSGVFTELDLLELMNVLNGAEMSDVWDGTSLPTLGGICP